MKPATELAKEGTSYQDFISRNLKEPNLLETFNKQSLYRARRAALILGGVLVTTLIFIVFAFVQDVNLKAVAKNKTNLESQLNLCIQAAQNEQGLATENLLILSEANKLAEEQLRACLSKK